MYMRKNKLVYNKGVRDIPSSFNNKHTEAYCKWIDMLGRCYSDKYLIRRPSYVGCSVCDDWLVFSNFNAWFNRNNVIGYHLDKDILVDGNKVYSPDTCCFVPLYINNLFLEQNSKRGEYPIGVSFEVSTNKYKAQLSEGKINKNLGRYDTAEDAHIAWVIEKQNYCIKIASDAYNRKEINKHVRDAIVNKAMRIC